MRTRPTLMSVQMVSRPPIILHLDRSGEPLGIYLERGGIRVTIEEGLREGITVTANDAPAILTLVRQFLESRDRYAR